MDTVLFAQNKYRETRGLEKVKVIHNENYKRHGTKSYVYLLNRFGFTPTKPGPYHFVDQPKEPGTIQEKVKAAFSTRGVSGRSLRKTVAKEDDATKGEVTAEDQQNDSMYLIQVSIGTPPQKLKLDPDTGSSDTWVMSPAQKKSTQQDHDLFDPSKSSTYKRLPGKTWKIQYGDGSTASGQVGTDTLVVGGISVENQVIETASTLSAQFSEQTGDGLLGLAFSQINTVEDHGKSDPQHTPVDNMITQKDIPKEAELFTSAFYSDRDQGKESFFTFGYIDQDLLKSLGEEIYWAPVDNSEGFWSVTSDSYSINGDKSSRSGNKAIMDTGTSLAIMSDDVVDALYAKIPGASYDDTNQGYVIPSTITLDELPEFKIDIGGKDFVIQKEDLIFAPIEGGSWYGGIQSRGDLTFDILGDVVLKSIYAVWDQGNTRFGAVPKIEKTQTLKLPNA
ncbi:putative aspartic endopeptidase protein [Eutypa lata UCREL1]|uniref:Putative aspartic endopeptidase protein n=1 Tax=Eutypa lata (strain UCR-EL1) TaxID=1287681 RepID=M7SHB1_EUTLA|nr:putative aspartic endopeptidase protein [Eutypa lata UCREL1]